MKRSDQPPGIRRRIPPIVWIRAVRDGLWIVWRHEPELKTVDLYLLEAVIKRRRVLVWSWYTVKSHGRDAPRFGTLTAAFDHCYERFGSPRPPELNASALELSPLPESAT